MEYPDYIPVFRRFFRSDLKESVVKAERQFLFSRSEDAMSTVDESNVVVAIRGRGWRRKKKRKWKKRQQRIARIVRNCAIQMTRASKKKERKKERNTSLVVARAVIRAHRLQRKC